MITDQQKAIYAEQADLTKLGKGDLSTVFLVDNFRNATQEIVSLLQSLNLGLVVMNAIKYEDEKETEAMTILKKKAIREYLQRGLNITSEDLKALTEVLEQAKKVSEPDKKSDESAGVEPTPSEENKEVVETPSAPESEPENETLPA